jgi:integral membrane protein (TIGR01906 family)
MQNERMLSFTNFLVAVIIAVFVVSASVTFTLFDRSAYARMQERIDLPDLIGFSEEEILANYNALIEYNSVFFTKPLTFPTLAMSESGRIHFEEVKTIFSAIQIMMIVSAALTAFLCVTFIKKRRYKFIRLGGIMSLVIPAIVVLAMLIIGWDRFFVIFHQLFFNNEYWVFDYRTDPIILLLPDTWFLYCLFRIIAGILVTSALLMILPSTFEKIINILNKKHKTL